MFKFKSKIYKEFSSSNDDSKIDTNGFLKDIIDGSVLEKKSVVQQLPYILFLVLLGVFYISNGYRSEQIYRDMLVLKKELKELRFESINTASALMYMSKQSEVVLRVNRANLGLKESSEPPIKILIKED